MMPGYLVAVEIVAPDRSPCAREERFHLNAVGSNPVEIFMLPNSLFFLIIFVKLVAGARFASFRQVVQLK
jgi:hypothetical protein